MSNSRPNCLAGKRNFFKFLVGDFTKRLKIPEAFIEQMPEELSGTTILKGPSGNCWHAKLNNTEHGTYLEDGWETFVKDHSLTSDDFLLFSYLGSMHFNVKVFDTTACEREDAFSVEVSHGLSEGKKKCQVPQRDAGKIASTSERKSLGEKAMEAVNCFTSQFPYFVAEMKAYSVRTHYFLTVPIYFANENFQRETRKLMFRNATGKTWMMKYCFGNPSRFAKGWRTFASDNQLKEGDYCVFELVNKRTMQVHIYRC